MSCHIGASDTRSTAGYAGEYLEGLRSIVPVVSLITLMIAAAATFWSCSFLPSQGHLGNEQVLGRSEPYAAVIGPSLKDIEPPEKVAPGRDGEVRY